MASWLVNTHGRSCLISASTEILKRLKRKSRLLLKRLWLKRNFRGMDCASSQDYCYSTQGHRPVWRHRGPLCLVSSLLLKPGDTACPWWLTGLQAPLLRPLNGWEWPLMHLHCLPQALKQEMEIKLTKNDCVVDFLNLEDRKESCFPPWSSKA